MATTIHPGPDEERTKHKAIHHWIAAAVVFIGLLLVTVSYIRGSFAINKALADSSASEPLLPGQATKAARPISAERSAVIDMAIVATPLRQALFHLAVIGEGHSKDSRWIEVLRRQGWRDTPALQTIVTYLAERNDLRGVLDVLDSLLRRRQAFAEGSNAVQTMEMLPDGRPLVVGLLARHPPWRHDYLVMAGDLKTAAAASGRYQVLIALQRRGDRLSRDEVAPLLPVLIRTGQASSAWALWQTLVGVGHTTSPLDDMRFRKLNALSLSDEEMSVPFEWKITTGQGFSVEPYSDKGGTMMGISWDGRGVPVFASQQTSETVPASHYKLSIATPDAPAIIASLLEFRLRCDDGSVTSFDTAGPVTNGILRYQTATRVACSFPLFEIAGRLQGTGSAHSIDLSEVRLTRSP
jgi:hypothetical protein